MAGDDTVVLRVAGSGGDAGRYRASPCRRCQRDHWRSTKAWWSQKTGSFTDPPPSIAPPTQRCTRLWLRQETLHRPVPHPSSLLRKPLVTVESQGALS